MRKRWDGLTVCTEDWAPRQPQDIIKIRPERIPKNTGIGEQSITPYTTYSSAMPIVRDNGGDGTYSDFIVTASSNGYLALTAGTYQYDSVLRYASFEGAGIGDGGITFISFTNSTSPTMAVGVRLTNDGGTFYYNVGNLVTSDNTGNTIFTGYTPGDELAVGTNAGVGSYGTIYLWRNGVLVDSHTLTSPLSTPPLAFGFYFPLLGAVSTFKVIETPVYEIDGATRYAQLLPMEFSPDEYGI